MNETTKMEQGRDPGETLEEAEALSGRWRAGRKRGARIPKALWAAAVAMAERYGVRQIAQQLGVDEQRLTKRVPRAGGVAPTGRRELRFVELLPGSVSPVPGGRECVIEMENIRGGKMRVELSGSGLASLSSLCSAFWGAP